MDQTMIYVYEAPEEFSRGYCFNGGVPIEFRNVDWFAVHSSMTENQIKDYIANKRYIQPGKSYFMLMPEVKKAFWL